MSVIALFHYMSLSPFNFMRNVKETLSKVGLSIKFFITSSFGHNSPANIINIVPKKSGGEEFKESSTLRNSL